MRSKLPKRCWLSFAIAFLSVLGATRAEALSFLPYDIPNTVVDDGTGTASSVYILHRTGVTGYNGLVADGYAVHDFSTKTFNFAVSGAAADATKTYVWVYAETTTSGEYKPITLSGCNGLPFGATGSCNHGTTDAFVISINFTTVCATITDIRGCTGPAVTVAAAAAIPGIRLRVLTGLVSAPGSAAAATATLLKVIPQVSPPVVTTPPLPGFFPGDGAILVETGGVTAVADTTSGSSPRFLKTFIVAQEGGTVTDGSETSASLVQAVDYQSGQQEVNGFVNSTASAQTFYEMKLGVQDSAGAIAFSATHYTQVFATDIQGFLRESNCFVATASYRDGRAGGVMLLREFRDEILSEFRLGRSFIDWYYRFGPIAADWLIERPIFRTVALMALLPVQAFAWLALHPAALLVPLFGLIFFLGFFAQVSGLLGLALLAALVAAPQAVAVDQPYIDSLISELPPEVKRTNENPDPYIQSLKRTIPPSEDTTGYTEEMKEQIGAKDGSEGYTERLKRGLPATTGSAIEDYRAGRKLRPNKGSLDTRSAFGFNLMASATRTYSGGDNQDVSYETVYGNGWVPEFTAHFEWRPFTGSFIKKFGLYTSVGASFTKAMGVFNYQDTTRFGSESRTEFRFIVLPLNVGLIYRFSLFDFMWPYFAGGPSAIGLIENRNDKQDGNQGYALGYWFTGGIAFGLDWLSAKSSWDQYETAAIKHSYFTIDYSYLESLGGGLVEFTVDGVKAGFTFEL